MPSLSEVNKVGKVQDVADRVIVADAKNTPIKAMARKGKKPVNTLYEWQVGAIPAPDTDSVPDGQPADTTEDMSGGRAMLRNRVHKSRRIVGVTEFAEDVSQAHGVNSEYNRSKANAILAVGRAMEAVFGGDQDCSLSGSKHTTRGLGSWISNSAQSDQPVPAAYRTPAASIYSSALTSLKESDILALMQSIYEQTGQMLNLDGIFGTALKTRVSTFTIYDGANVSSSSAPVRVFNAQLKEGTLFSGVEFIKGDFGRIRCHPTLWNAFNNTTKTADSKRGYLLDMDDFEVVTNKAPYHKVLADDDSGPRGVVAAIYGNRLGSPLRHGKIAAS